MSGLDWAPRFPALLPTGVAADGEAAARLVAEAWAGVAQGRRFALDDAPEGVVVVRVLDGGAVPWVDGCVPLGTCPLAPALLLPTARQPRAPLALLVQALRAQVGEDGVLVLLPGPSLRCLTLAAPWPLVQP